MRTMVEAYLPMPDRRRDGRAAAVAVVAMGFLWRAIRLPILMLLVVLEPIVRLICAGLALLGVLITIFFKLAGPPTFPWVTMLAISLTFALILIAYYAVIRLLSGESR